MTGHLILLRKSEILWRSKDFELTPEKIKNINTASEKLAKNSDAVFTYSLVINETKPNK